MDEKLQTKKKSKVEMNEEEEEQNFNKKPAKNQQ